VLEPEYTPEELASADAGLGGGGDPLIPLGPPEEQVLIIRIAISADETDLPQFAHSTSGICLCFGHWCYMQCVEAS
jgi:hypothetical protein